MSALISTRGLRPGFVGQGLSFTGWPGAHCADQAVTSQSPACLCLLNAEIYGRSTSKAESSFSKQKDPENLLKNLVLIYGKKKTLNVFSSMGRFNYLIHCFVYVCLSRSQTDA